MTDDDLDRIERELSISLPASYREAVNPFPIATYVGNHETYLWDDADELIRENQLLRSTEYGQEPWKPHFFCCGRVGGADAYAIDTRDAQGPVWWVDYCHFSAAGTHCEFEDFDSFLQRTRGDLLHDLEGDGIDPATSPEEREQLERESGCAMIGAVVVFIVAVVVALVLYALFVR